MDPEQKHSKQRAVENLPDGLVEHIESVPFEYPEDEKEDAHSLDRDIIEKKLRNFLVNFVSLDPFDFIILQQRVLYNRNCREIGRQPLMPGRMSVRARCEELSKKFTMFRTQLVAGFEADDKQDQDHAKIQKSRS